MLIAIGFCNSKKNSKISRLIRLIDRMHASHVYIQLSNIIYHASEDNRNALSLKEFNSEYIITDTFLINVDEMTYNKIKEFCYSRIEMKYNRLAVLGCGLYKIFKNKNLFWDENKHICTEYIGRILNILLCNIDENKLKVMSIKDIYNEIIKIFNNDKAVKGGI